VEGNPEAKVTSFAKIEHGKPGQLCFFANPKYEQYVYTSRASVLLVNLDFQPKQPVTPTLVRVENAYSALADLLKYMSEQKKKYRRRRSLRSRIAWSAKLGKRVSVGDFVTIGKDCVIGEGTIIHDNVTIGAGTKIGSYCIIYPGVHIFPGMVIGDRVILHAGCIIGDDGFGNAQQPDGSWRKIEHVGNVIIGNDVEIGSNTTVDRAPMESTIIGDGVRIDNLCQIAHNVIIGKHTVMAAQTGIAGSAQIGEYCVIAGQVGIVGHIKVADHTTIGAQAGVIGAVRKPGETLLGMPAIPHRTFMKAYAKFKHAGEEE
jgi:UDP-3-O-[3-hydroxymyristoyl] glucosamine N-acyltransferase